ncbi:hypothetical protein Pmar_PMAR007520 [Perkinsus marinus ATCC 50983]|uniref:Uncharacterized protein n=1 Tax=Perkinsus marinus (strain ATCC 50983 / TXsc) TaxID=423536 RepID=C5LXU5_PERM5|nr:hypothetical protein Pmar_PMAR007520 [Perkinsus marinus ATCC 50983]EEQ98447.1 hypothetical protein Pmar_PMAR007520 [Perkinsus marinus ATCC 50983]|eukprot:XP_002765730.1 hypothetical protein Pmar_PMAR007520 [Perkinsus marinus ATCC 50983]
MTEPVSPRIALMAAQQRQVLETTGRLVTQGVQTVYSEEEVVTGGVDIGSQTENFLVEDKANPEASDKAVGEDVAYSDTPKGTVSVPVNDGCEKPCPEEDIEIDFVREPEHYCVGCAAAFAIWTSLPSIALAIFALPRLGVPA